MRNKPPIAFCSRTLSATLGPDSARRRYWKRRGGVVWNEMILTAFLFVCFRLLGEAGRRSKLLLIYKTQFYKHYLQCRSHYKPNWFFLHVKWRLAPAFLLEIRQRKVFRTVYLCVVWSPASKRFSLQYSTYRTILTLLIMWVTYAGNTILNTVTYRKYNYLHYGLLTLLTIQYSAYILYITCWTNSYLQFVTLYIDFEEGGVLLNRTFN